MKKIGIFLDEITDSSIPESEKLAKLGNNTGNMLFWESLKSNLDLEVIPRRYINDPQKLDLSRFSAFVTTDLIWIRQMQDFSYLNKTLDAIGELPLIPISIGLQCDRMIPDFRLHPETVRVIRRISERCVMGVRGNYTAEILKSYGIDNFMVIGCPSMYMDTAGLLSVGTEKKSVGRVSANFETFYKKLDKPRLDFLRYCAENDFSFAEQTAASVSEKQIGDPLLLKNVQSWLGKNSHRFFDINEWRSYIRGFDLSIGARFHGNVIALWENVPALFLVTDSRTKELCEHFALPHIDISDFDRSEPVEYYYGLADYSEFHKNYPKRVGEWKNYLLSNGLTEENAMNKEAIQNKSSSHKKTAIFHTDHRGGLSRLVTLRLNRFADHSAVLLIYDGDSEYKEIFRKYEENGIFDKVLFFNHGTTLKKNGKSAILNELCGYYDALSESGGISLENADVICTAGDIYNPFALYLSAKKKSYSIVELCDGQLSDKSRYDIAFNIGDISADFRELQTEYHVLCGEDGGFCERIFVSGVTLDRLDSKLYESCITEKTDFDADLKNTAPENRKKLLSCYHDDLNELFADGQSTVLLLFNSLGYSRNAPYPDEKLPYIYQMLMDYYLASFDNIILKDHPNSFMTSSRNFPECRKISGYMPIEYINLTDGLKLSAVASISTTGISKIRERIGRNIEAGIGYFRATPLLHRMYTAFSVYKFLGNFGQELHQKISSDEVMQTYIDNVFPELASKIGGLNMNIIGNAFIVCGDCTPENGRNIINGLKNAHERAVVVFLNGNNAYDFISPDYPEVMDHILPIKVREEALENSLGVNAERFIYLFSKDRSVIEKMKDFSISRRLKYSRMNISAFTVSGRESENERKHLYTLLFNRQHLRSTDNLIRYFSDSRNIADKLIFILKALRAQGFDCKDLFHYGIHNSVIWSLSAYIFASDFKKSAWSILHFSDNSVTIIDNIYWNPGNQADILNRKMNEMPEESGAVIIFLRKIQALDCFKDGSVLSRNVVEVKVSDNEYVYVYSKNKDRIIRLLADMRS